MPVDIQSAAVPFSPLIGVAPLMRLAFREEDLQPLGMTLLARAQANPGDANACLDCSTVLQLTGEHDIALAVQMQAIDIQSLYHLPAKKPGPGLRLLVLMGPGDLMSNTPIEFLVEDSDVSIDLLYLTLEHALPESVPDHDVLLVALAESDANQPLLEIVAAFVADWPRPVINLPQRIARLTRNGVYAELKDLPGVAIPMTARVDRATLAGLAAGEIALASVLPENTYPLIVRPIGSHAGTFLEKISAAADLNDYLGRVDSAGFYLSRFVDYSSADGLFRKYRVALVDGQPFLCHFAVSSHWMVHYLNAGMNESAEKRAEEAVRMANFSTEFAARHATALRAINDTMGLPYLGIDCAETRDGELLIFEIDNAMIVHAMDPPDLYPYKKPAMQKVFTAFRALLEARRHTGSAD